MTIFALLANDDYGDGCYFIGYYTSEEKAEKAALEKEWMDYEAKKKNDSGMVRTLPPDERRYRKYTIQPLECLDE